MYVSSPLISIIAMNTTACSTPRMTIETITFVRSGLPFRFLCLFSTLISTCNTFKSAYKARVPCFKCTVAAVILKDLAAFLTGCDAFLNGGCVGN